MGADWIRVEVVHLGADDQFTVSLTLNAGATVLDAVRRSGIESRFPEVRGFPAGVGIWGHLVERDRVLADGDRVEIYRPLVADPKEARRRRAAAAAPRRR